MPISGVDSRPLASKTSSLESRPPTPVSGIESSRLRTPASSVDSCPDTPGSSGTECCPCTLSSEPRPCPPSSGRNLEGRKFIPATIQECHPATPPNSLKSDSHPVDNDDDSDCQGASPTQGATATLEVRPGTPASSLENNPPTPETAISVCPQHPQKHQEQLQKLHQQQSLTGSVVGASAIASSSVAQAAIPSSSSIGIDTRPRGSLASNQSSFRSHNPAGPYQRPKLRTPAGSVDSRPRTPGSTRCGIPQTPRNALLPVYGDVTK